MTTFLGFVSGVALLFYAIVNRGGAEIFLNSSALMIVAGGTMAALLISFPLPRIMKVMGVLLQIFKKEIQNPSWVIKLVVELSFKARRQSLLALEEDLKRIDNRLLKMGVELVTDGQPAMIVREVLETEVDFVQARHRGGEQIFRSAARYAPSFGMIGTLIGLVSMLRHVGGDADSAGAIGQGMAVALITTFYGTMMANLFFTPVAEKLRNRSDDELLVSRIAIEGLLMIQSGVNPRIIEQKLNSFLPPDMRAAHYDSVLQESKKRADETGW